MNTVHRNRFSFIQYAIVPLLGFLFLLWYIRTAAADAVYSDYLRLVHDYLPDVADPSRFLVPDVLTRIPAAFLARYVNVRSFSYAVTFDRILSVLGLVLMSVVLSAYAAQMEIRFRWQAAVGVVLFSLTKWEILLNGTAWAHVASFGLFFLNYLLLDHLWRKETDAREELLLCMMPFLWLFFAGEYIASYAATMVLICIFGMLTGGANSVAGKKEQGLYQGILITTVLALGMYLVSRHFAVWEHAGSTSMTLSEAIRENPLFLPRFFLKSLAGAVVGQETLQNFLGTGRALPDTAVLILGGLVFLTYLLAFFMYFSDDLLERTVFPLILLISGLINHVLVTAGRWIFLKEDYGLSSRYSGQFVIGLIGILLVFALYGSDRRRKLRRKALKNRRIIRGISVVLTVFILAGNCYTSYQEIRKAPYREANYEAMAEALLHADEYTDEDLAARLEWHKDPAVMRESIDILKENKLNVFARPAPAEAIPEPAPAAGDG